MIRIIIESDKKSNEYQFILKLIGLWFPKWQQDDNFEIIPIGGYTKLKSLEGRNVLNRAIDGKDVNLVIFDADTSKNDGGFEIRGKDILNWKRELGLNFELFLFPNHKDDGMFETLLERILHTEHHCLLNCFEGYCQCVDKKKKYNVPLYKSKIYACLDALFAKDSESQKRLKNGAWFEDKNKFWDYESTALDSLRNFLTQFVDDKVSI